MPRVRLRFHQDKRIWQVVLFTLLTACVTADILSPDALAPGSITLERPEKVQPLPDTIYQISENDRPIPTNQWWSSLMWKPFSENLFAHPIVARCQKEGLAIGHAGVGVTGAGGHIMSAALGPQGDLLLGLSDNSSFSRADYHSSSDWFLTLQLQHEKSPLLTHFGHGSPFLFFEHSVASDRPQPKISLAQKPTRPPIHHQPNQLIITLHERHYALYGSSGSEWKKMDDNSYILHDSKGYFSIGLLPDDSADTLETFASLAHNHVTNTEVSYRFSEGTIETLYSFHCVAREGKSSEKNLKTLFALYPHQWKYTKAPLTKSSFLSPRGPMKLAIGNSFTTHISQQGLLPYLSGEAISDQSALLSQLEKEAAKPTPPVKDSYWGGKDLGKLVSLAGVAEAIDAADLQKTFLNQAATLLENWFSTKVNDALLYYDRSWNTLIASPPAYGSDKELNDHHFHYGYFIRAAAEITRHNPEWGEQWAPIVNLLVRDIASPDHKDQLFPYLRCFDLYAGHSWASGHANFSDGNNQESASEALNAWYALALWGEVSNQKTIRDLGLFLFNTELTAMEEYWFDVAETNFPSNYPNPTLGMIWGGKGAYGTWFSGNADHIHGINWLPFTPASLFLGRNPAYVERNFKHLVAHREADDDFQKDWGDLILMYGALYDPSPARKHLSTFPNASCEAGNSRPFMEHWVSTLEKYGQPAPKIVADSPWALALRKNETITYLAYNWTDQPQSVKFSDGKEIIAKSKTLTVSEINNSK